MATICGVIIASITVYKCNQDSLNKITPSDSISIVEQDNNALHKKNVFIDSTTETHPNVEVISEEETKINSTKLKVVKRSKLTESKSLIHDETGLIFSVVHLYESFAAINLTIPGEESRYMSKVYPGTSWNFIHEKNEYIIIFKTIIKPSDFGNMVVDGENMVEALLYKKISIKE